MKCLECGKTNYVQDHITDEIQIDGGPTLRIKGIDAQVCPKCGDVLMDAVSSAKRTQAALAALVQHYSSNFEIPGKVAKWMRKSIDLSATDWATAASMDASSFSQAAQRNSTVDRYAALILLARTADFVSGSKRAEQLIQRTHELEKFMNPELLSLVEVA